MQIYLNKNAVEMQWKLHNKRTAGRFCQNSPQLMALYFLLTSNQNQNFQRFKPLLLLQLLQCRHVYLPFHNSDLSNRFNPKREIESNLLTFAPLEIPQSGQ